MQILGNWRSVLWLLAAATAIAIYLSVVFLTTLGADDWRDCFGASSRPHRLAIQYYSWTMHREEFAWGLAAAIPVALCLALLRSPWLGLICWVLLLPLVKTMLGDFSLMLGEWLNGDVVTAQGGYHHCDRKGHDKADIMRYWLYVSSFIITISAVSIAARPRRKSRPGDDGDSMKESAA